MDLTMHRCRTERSWRHMRDTFDREWRDGFQTMADHQFRVTRNGVQGGGQVSDWYCAHALRQIDERWPEFKGERT